MPIEPGNAKMTIYEWSKLNSDDRWRVLQRSICVKADVPEMVEMIIDFTFSVILADDWIPTLEVLLKA